jgi:hypothetical protein
MGSATNADTSRVRVLIITQDIEVIDVLCHTMQRLAMHAEICQDTATALRKTCRSKYEGLVVDFVLEKDAVEFMNRMHDSTAHRQSITFAILDDGRDLRTGVTAGAHFLLKRPLVPQQVYRTLKASYSLMVRERRRCFRCPATFPVTVLPKSGARFAAVSINISEGGMALEMSSAMQVDELVELHFRLPGQNESISLGAEVCWAKSDRVGLQFCRVTRDTSEKLQSWLSERLQEDLPEADSCNPKQWD